MSIEGQRWFAGKGREVARTAERDRASVGAAALALCDVEFREGAPETYLLFEGDPQALLEAIFEERRLGGFRFQCPLSKEGRGSGRGASPRLFTGEQSNTTFAFGDRFILKLFRKLEPGPNPELEMLRFLEEQGFPRVPRIAGWIEHEGLGATAGVLETFIPNRGDAWTWTCGKGSDPFPQVQGAQHPFFRLGRVTAELHAALRARADLPAFAPEPVARADLESWAERIAALARDVFGYANVTGLSAGPFVERARALAGLAPAGLVKARAHGDYHLGQVLVTPDGDFAIFDFEGEPARPLAERRRKHAQVRDVAGMLRSFGYAAEVARARPGFEAAAREAFLEGYGLRPEEEPLVAIFEMEKAIYELGYETRNRPAWVEIPAGALRRLA